MSEQKYPNTSIEELRALRKFKKEKLVAIICYLTNRLGVNETAMKEIIAAHEDVDLQYEHFRHFTKVVKRLFETTMQLMKNYHEIIPDIVAEPRVIVYKIKSSSCSDNSECTSCQKEEHSTTQYDPSDITIQ